MSTSVPQCTWPGSGDGEYTSTGTIRFTGTKEDNTTISEDFTISSTNFTDMLPFTFTDSIWGGVSLKSMELEMVATEDSTNYWAFDNLVFESVGTVSAVNINKEAITIYPNPTTGKITLNALEVAEEVKIYNSLGELVKTGLITNQEFDISNLPNGVYYLTIYIENQSVVKRILKQ